MSGNAKNTQQWQGADVYIAPLGTTAPNDLTTAFSNTWELVGLLDGEEGFTEKRDADTGENYAWGGLLYRRHTSKQKRTIKFVALEDNDTTFALANPGSVRTSTTGVRHSTVKVPVSGTRFSIAFELHDGTTVKRRIVPTAELSDFGDLKQSESDPTVWEFTVMIFPDAATNVLYTDIETDPDYVAP